MFSISGPKRIMLDGWMFVLDGWMFATKFFNILNMSPRRIMLNGWKVLLLIICTRRIMLNGWISIPSKDLY